MEQVNSFATGGGRTQVTDNARAIYEDILAGGYERIKRFCMEEQEEGLFLDFKSKADPAKAGMDN